MPVDLAVLLPFQDGVGSQLRRCQRQPCRDIPSVSWPNPRHTAAHRASEVFSQHFLQRRHIHHLLGQQFLQLGILGLQRLQLLGIRHFHLAELLLQFMVLHKDDPLLVAFAPDEGLASVLRDIADLQVCQFTDPQSGYDQQLNDQDRDIVLRGWLSVVCARFRPRSDGAFTGLKNRSEDVSIDGARQATRDPHRDTDVGERGGQGVVPVFALGKVRFEGHSSLSFRYDLTGPLRESHGLNRNVTFDKNQTGSTNFAATFWAERSVATGILSINRTPFSQAATNRRAGWSAVVNVSRSESLRNSK